VPGRLEEGQGGAGWEAKSAPHETLDPARKYWPSFFGHFPGNFFLSNLGNSIWDAGVFGDFGSHWLDFAVVPGAGMLPRTCVREWHGVQGGSVRHQKRD
jgi:hypothetical protein